MSYSPLAGAYIPANPGNYTAGRPGGGIVKITVHHMAGVLSAERCGQIFQTPGRGGSAHYGVGFGGEIACYVEEENTAWADSNWNSNIHSVTIETSNSANGGDWPVSDASYESLIKLVADIAKRNGLGTLVPGQNLTWHSMYAATSCPGDYLRARMDDIAARANAINASPAPSPAPTPAPSTDLAVGDKVVLKDWVDFNGTPLMQTRPFYYISEINGNRAVLRADSMDGVVYCAANTGNLEKVDDGAAPAPSPAPLGIGDKVLPINWVDFNGTLLMQTRPFYYISEISGNRAILRADNPTNGTIYAAVVLSNLRKV